MTMRAILEPVLRVIDGGVHDEHGMSVLITERCCGFDLPRLYIVSNKVTIMLWSKTNVAQMSEFGVFN